MLQDITREGEALKLRLNETEDEEEEEEVKREVKLEVGSLPARIQIVETDVVKPRKPSLVHLTAPDMMDLTKAQRRYKVVQVQCTVYRVYSVHCTVYCTLYTVHCTVYCTLYTVQYSVQCTVQ